MRRTYMDLANCIVKVIRPRWGRINLADMYYLRIFPPIEILLLYLAQISGMLSFPNAKINIGLNVVEKRPDSYHNIETVFYPVHLSDVLEFIESDEDEKLDVSGISIDGNVHDNLVMKAYFLMKKRFSLPPLRFHLHKIIPSGAGLGGGSSDAAYTIISINDHFRLNISDDEMEDIASELGSDCAFFIRNKPVFASGRGNEFKESFPEITSCSVLIVHPGIHVNTSEAYRMVKPVKPERSLEELIKQPLPAWRNSIINDFEEGVFKKFPLISEIKNELYSLGAIYASMSGSGSSVYGIFDNLPVIPDKFKHCFTWAGSLNLNSI